MKRKRSVTFAGPSVDDAKTSEFAFFNKLKSSFGLSSEVKQNSESRNQSGGQSHNDVGMDRQAKARFSTPIYNTRRASSALPISPLNFTPKDKGFNRGKDTVLGDNNNNNMSCGGSSDDKEDFFYVKRKRLNQWVKDTWFPQITPKLTLNGGDLVSLLLTRLFPGTDEKHPSRFSKERTDRRTFLDSPGSSFLKRSHERYTQVDHSLQMEKNTSCGWLSAPSLQFARNNLLISRDPEEFSISYPKERVYRPPLLTHKASLSFPVEESRDSSLLFRNHKSFSLGYHGEEIGYSSSHDHREPSSAVLLEWNTENVSTRKTAELPLSYYTKLITCPNPNASSSLADNPWRSDYSSSHDVVTRELYPLHLLSHDTSRSFLLPATNQTSDFDEHEFETHIIDDEDMFAANQNLQTFHDATSSSDCLTRDYTYYHSLLDHSPSKVSGGEMVSFPFSSISKSSDLLEASSPTTQSDRWWI